MPSRRWPRPTAFRPEAGRSARRTILLLGAALLLSAALALGAALRSMVTEYAASAARDQVVSKVNDIVKELMTDAAFQGESLVTLERDENGSVTAISANVPAVNLLASQVLSRAVAETEQENIVVDIPLANLFGSALFMNRGPSIPVHVAVLGSSRAGFRSEMTAAGINQTRHQLFLDLDVQLSFLMPWRDMDTSVQTQILVSETVIVGKVPESYMNWER